MAAGYPRDFTHFPVEYPTASSPQAWAAGTPLLLLRVLLGLEPSDKGPTVDPVLPEGVGRLALRGVPARWGRAITDRRGPVSRAGMPAWDTRGQPRHSRNAVSSRSRASSVIVSAGSSPRVRTVRRIWSR